MSPIDRINIRILQTVISTYVLLGPPRLYYRGFGCPRTGLKLILKDQMDPTVGAIYRIGYHILVQSYMDHK